MDPFVGEIRMLAFNYAPRGWAQCDGATLPISQNQALFALLGTQFGGNGVNTFQLPDLRGRTPMGTGAIAPQGTALGVEQHALLPGEIPAHTHQVVVNDAAGTVTIPAGNFIASVDGAYAPPDAKMTTLHPASVSTAGNAVAHENRQPFTTINFAIALTGIFPPRP